MSNKGHPCLFCSIQKRKDQILYEDDFVFIIHDLEKASAKEHILICSKEHIKNILSLTKEHIPLVLLMKQKALTLLNDLNKTSYGKFRLGFHLPPLIMIDHLHLHGFIEPLNSFVFDFLYKPEVCLLSPNKICDILRNGQNVKSYLMKRLLFIIMIIIFFFVVLIWFFKH